MRTIVNAVSTLCTTVFFCLLALFGMNWAAEHYLRANPELHLTRDQRIHENTRAVREAMIPKDKVTVWYDLESPDDLLPMWEELYSGGVEFESYVHYRSRTKVGRFYGMTETGFRQVREQGPWPLQPDGYNVFFFGGSTSFGVGPYWATVASYLQEAMNADQRIDRDVRVYNFGRSGYHTNQEIILFQRLLSAGHVPDMVVFLDGLNDFCFTDTNPSGWTALARHFNAINEVAARKAQYGGIVTEWQKAASFFETLPLTRLINASLARLTEEPAPEYRKPEEAVEEKPESDAVLNTIIDRYISFKRQVEGVSSAFGISPVFVWQPIPTYKYDGSHHLFYPDRLGCHVNSKFGYPLMAGRVDREGGLGSNFLWAADMQQDLKEPLYIDAFHYTAPMSARLAALIGEHIRDNDLMTPPGER